MRKKEGIIGVGLNMGRISKKDKLVKDFIIGFYLYVEFKKRWFYGSWK